MYTAGWLVYCHYILRNYYGNDPLFEESKIVTSIYNQSFEGTLNEDMYEKLQFDALDDEVISPFQEPSYLNLMRSAVVYSDGVIKGSETLDSELEEFIDESGQTCSRISISRRFC